MTARASLRSFLAEARATLTAPAAQRPRPLTFVVGNESADLDSLCSAVVYAYLRTHAAALGNSSSSADLHVPLSNLARADLALRPELTAALAHAQLKPSDLLCLDDLPPASALDAASTRWVLVDHNTLTGHLRARGFPSHIVGCVDHHEDEEEVITTQNSEEPRVIEKTGSCCSLVAEYCRRGWEETVTAEAGKTESKHNEVDEHVARLALAPILVDTANLKSAEKTTDSDVRAVEFLEAFLSGGNTGYDRDVYFNELTRTKEDLSGMAFRDIFRKDFKLWEEDGMVLGMSSVPQGLEYLIRDKAERGKDVVLAELRKWADEKKLDVAVVMTTLHPQGAFHRELLVWAFNEGAVKVVEDFIRSNHEELGLADWTLEKLDHVAKGEFRKAWRQGNLAHSRKKVAPMLREAMKRRGKL